VKSFIEKFRNEFEAHIREKRCPMRGAAPGRPTTP